MRIATLLSLLLCGWTVAALPLRADEVLLKNKERIPGPIRSEGSLGVFVDGRKEIISAIDILDTRYTKKQNDPSSEPYYSALAKEKEIVEKTKDRLPLLLQAVNLYQQVLDKLAKDPSEDLVRRNVEFRIAFLRSRMALEHNASVDIALAALKNFKDRHPDSWQISHCLQRLAALQIAQKKFAEAEKTYLELSKAPIAEQAKQEAEFLSAELSMKIKKYDQALTRFQALAGKLPRNSPFKIRAVVYEAECLALAKKTDQANKLLRQLLKDSSDKNNKALAHNALGKNFFDQGLYKEARWEFLWVDVIYNQDKAEHAKALYYLAQTFDKLGETERAQECRDVLFSDQFAGLEFQKK